jgi:hypothetical protein
MTLQRRSRLSLSNSKAAEFPNSRTNDSFYSMIGNARICNQQLYSTLTRKVGLEGVGNPHATKALNVGSISVTLELYTDMLRV